MIFELLFWVANIFPNSKFGNSNNQTCKNCFPASSKLLKSWFDLLSPCSLFNLLTKLEKKKVKFLEHWKHRLIQSADEPSLTYLPQLEESLLKKGNGDYESSKTSRLQQRCTGCLPHFQLILQASAFPWNKGLRHTQTQPEERSRHHVVCQLFMDHSLQLSQQLEAFIYFQSLYCFKSHSSSSSWFAHVSLVTNNHKVQDYLIYKWL